MSTTAPGRGGLPDLGADLVLMGGDVRTLDPARPHATGLAVKRGRIIAVGDDTDVAVRRGRHTETIDLQGATLTPGLVDGHTHPVLGADNTAGVDLSGCTDLTSLRTTLADFAPGVAGEQWIRGWGLDPNVFGDGPVRASAIEEVLGGRPAFLYLFDGHAALASGEAMRRAGVDGPRRYASGSFVECDERGPTGHLLEMEAVNLVSAAMPAEPAAVRHRRLRAVLDGMAASGLTGGHVMDASGDSLEVLALLDDQGTLPLRLRLAPWCGPDDDVEEIEALAALQATGGRLWEVAAVKLFMDGTIDGGTAWLHSPDCHGQSTTPSWEDPQAYATAVRRFARLGIQTVTHAIGDAAVEHVLDTLASVPARGPTRHRVEHIETLPTDQVARFAALGVVASMQPTHATDYTRADRGDNWSQRLGDERAGRGWRCRDILDAGATVVLGSDWPVAPYDPRLTLAAAQHRRPARRPEIAAVGPEQGLTAMQALLGYTVAPAEASSESDRAGRLAVGYRADITAFAADPITTPAADLPDVPIVLTVVDGVVRHR